MKKIIIQHGTLKAILKRLKQVIVSKSTIPTLGNVLIKVQQNATATITATDMELTIQCDCTVEYGEQSEEAFDILVPFDFLSKVVSVSEHSLAFELKSEDEKTIIHITTGNDYYCAGAMDDVTEYPKLQAVPKRKFIELNGTFIETLNNAIPSVTKDEFRVAMQHVCLDISKDGIIVVGTDAHMLFSKRIADGSDHTEKLLVSPKAAKALEGFKNARVAWNEKVISFESDGITVICNRHTEQYPTWQAVFPNDLNSTIHVDKLALLTALAKCNISDLETKDTLFNMAPTMLTMESNSYEDGKVIKTQVECEFAGTIEYICFNCKKLETLIDSISGESLSKNPRLKLSLSQPNKGMVITTEEDESFQLLIMPIMILKNK